MSSRAATSRFFTLALFASTRSASPAGMLATVAAGAGSLPVASDETARQIVASQKSARFMGVPLRSNEAVHQLGPCLQHRAADSFRSARSEARRRTSDLTTPSTSGRTRTEHPPIAWLGHRLPSRHGTTLRGGIQ